MSPASRRSYTALLRGAREVFEAKGYLNARIADIAEAAGVAVGTFYTYFDSKEQLFEELLLEVQHEVLFASSDERDAKRSSHRPSPAESIRKANRRYLQAFQRHARFWIAVEEAALLNTSVQQILRSRREAYNNQTDSAIRRWTDRGLAHPAVSSTIAAEALGAMTERCAFLWYVFGEPPSMDDAVEALTACWARSLNLAAANTVRRDRSNESAEPA